jgi:ATP-binding protein involved in chromosome partitioning
MFAKTNVSVLGIVENMSYFLSPSDGRRYDIFGSGGGQREAARLQTSLLGQIPIEIAIREGGDLGRPVADEDPEGAASQEFTRIVRKILEKTGTVSVKS